MGARKSGARAQRGAASLFTLPAFLALFVAVSLLWHPPPWVALLYVAASVATFLAYANDKAAARHRGWRTREDALHVLALAGGWPGAVVAQQYLRHKSSKASFRAVFWATVILNVAAFVFLCSPAPTLAWRAWAASHP